MLSPEIVERFSGWLADAQADKTMLEPTAMTLSTASDGQPSSRVVLLKDFDLRGFVFYSNSQSRKGAELAENPQVALNFHWMPLRRQVRVEGKVERVSDAEADTYFASRARQSQLGAWASHQSQPMPSRGVFEEAIVHFEEKFAGQNVPRPPHWWGWRVIPKSVEFWQERQFRVHEREVYTREGIGWTRVMLYP